MMLLGLLDPAQNRVHYSACESMVIIEEVMGFEGMPWI
jgi:hypothetical protein